MNVRPFDFREIAALDDTAVAIRNWVSKSTSFFSDHWVDATGFGAKLALTNVTNEAYANVLNEIPRRDLCCTLAIKDRTDAMWYASAEQLRILVNDLLGLPSPVKSGSDEANEDESAEQDSQEQRDLSPIELDLAGHFIERLADSITNGWLGGDDLEIEVTPLEKDPRKLRLFRGKDLVSKISLQIECKTGTASMNWLIPKQKMSVLMEDVIESRSQSQSNSPSKEFVGTLPLKVTTLLGTTKVPMTELANLKPGNLIVLDQRIDAPMTSLVDGKPSFECWPGRLGNMQAVQVSTNPPS